MHIYTKQLNINDLTAAQGSKGQLKSHYCTLIFKTKSKFIKEICILLFFIYLYICLFNCDTLEELWNIILKKGLLLVTGFLTLKNNLLSLQENRHPHLTSILELHCQQYTIFSQTCLGFVFAFCLGVCQPFFLSKILSAQFILHSLASVQTLTLQPLLEIGWPQICCSISTSFPLKPLVSCLHLSLLPPATPGSDTTLFSLMVDSYSFTVSILLQSCCQMCHRPFDFNARWEDLCQTTPSFSPVTCFTAAEEM